MKPAPFDYARAGSVREVLELLAVHGERARVLAGGQSLLPLLAARALRPDLLVDINRVPGLASVEVVDGENGVIRIGATVRQRAVERDAAVATAVPLLARALPLVGSVGTRNRGTVAGSIAFADPAAELPAVLLACGGAVEVASTGGRRTIPADELFAGPRRTALAPTELVTAVRFPTAASGARTSWVEFGRRPGDLPLVGVGTVVELDDGRITALTIACGGVHDRPWIPEAAIAEVRGTAVSAGVLDHLAETAAATCAPVEDARTTAAHRRLLVRTLVRRALAQALGQRGVHADAA